MFLYILFPSSPFSFIYNNYFKLMNSSSLSSPSFSYKYIIVQVSFPPSPLHHLIHQIFSILSETLHSYHPLSLSILSLFFSYLFYTLHIKYIHILYIHSSLSIYINTLINIQIHSLIISTLILFPSILNLLIISINKNKKMNENG